MLLVPISPYAVQLFVGGCHIRCLPASVPCKPQRLVPGTRNAGKGEMSCPGSSNLEIDD